MTPEERVPLLAALAQLSRRQDAQSVDPLTTFLPLPMHRRALSPEVVVVLGGRGAGKTALFRLVNDPQSAPKLRAFFEDERIPDASWIDAFSQTGTHHPEVGTLEAYASSASDITLRAFWMTHLLRRVGEEIPAIVKPPSAVEGVLSAPVADLAAWLPAAEANLGAISATLDAAERALQDAGRSVFAAYDNLDLIGQFDPSIRRRYVSTLLSLWLSLSNRYRRLRGKIFLRDDLFDAGELRFADATKLRPFSEAITWDHASLYRVVVRHLAGSSEAMRAWLSGVPGLSLRDRGEFGWMPGEMPESVQQAFAGRLAGKVIGKGVLKGYTYKWILSRLQDALERITPRSMLWFFGFAGTEAAMHRGGRKTALVSASDLLTALQQTSRERVSEIKEEYELVKRLENLRGMTIPLDHEEVVRRLGEPHPDEPKGIPAQGDAVLRELIRIGVLRVRDDGQVDVPDIYRYSFEIAPDYEEAWEGFLAGDDSSAQHQFERELPGLKEIFQREGAALQWSGVGEEELQRGDHVAARARCERALELAQNAGDRSGEAELWSQLGRVSLEQCEPQRAREEFRHAGEIAKRTGNRSLEADLHWWLGRSNSLLKKYTSARLEFSRAARLYRKVRNQEREVSCEIGLGDVEMDRGRVSVAIEHFLKALMLAQDDMKSVWEIFVIWGIAHVTVHLGKSHEALRLMGLGMHLIDVRKESLESLPAEYDRLASELHYTPEQLEALRREVESAYARDRGWGYVREVFPDQVEALKR